jgi:hypothetical protein
MKNGQFVCRGAIHENSAERVDGRRGRLPACRLCEHDDGPVSTGVVWTDVNGSFRRPLSHSGFACAGRRGGSADEHAGSAAIAR